jgi:hypothetical protein
VIILSGLAWGCFFGPGGGCAPGLDFGPGGKGWNGFGMGRRRRGRFFGDVKMRFQDGRRGSLEGGHVIGHVIGDSSSSLMGCRMRDSLRWVKCVTCLEIICSRPIPATHQSKASMTSIRAQIV